MIEILRRCIHCGTVYNYQMSGYGAPEYNHSQYCKLCYEKICDTLKKVPVKFKKVLIECNDYTKEEIIEKVKEQEAIRKQAIKDNENDENAPINLKLNITRIYPPMWDTNDPSNRNIVEDITIDNTKYLYSYWTKTDEFILRKEMELDCETNEIIGPWREIKNTY